MNLKRSEPKIWKSLVGASASIATTGVAIGMEAAKVKKLQTQIQAYMTLYKAVAKEFAKQTKGVMDLAKKGRDSTCHGSSQPRPREPENGSASKADQENKGMEQIGRRRQGVCTRG